MPHIIAYTVPGTPKAQPRVKAFRRGNHAAVYNPGTADDWKRAVMAAAMPHLPSTPLAGPVRVDLDFYLPRPKRLYRKRDADDPIPHIGKPDAENLSKSTCDALTACGMWRDDSQVCWLVVKKSYHAKDGSPGATIRVEDLADG